jgi:hypothetical protein
MKTKSIVATVLFACGVIFIAASCSKNERDETPAIPANDFLNSMGVVSSVDSRGEKLEETIENIQYTGLRWLRVGYEDDVPPEYFLRLHRETGALLSYGMLSGCNDINRLLRESRQLAEAGALLALEGSNEPNNWDVTYCGRKGGGQDSWWPVAEMHRDLYQKAKRDPVLKDYPVWAATETGAQTDNTGLHFLLIPEGAQTLMPDGTQFADYLNCHNYITHPSWPGLHDNQTWISASPGKDCPVDGLYNNNGLTWKNRFAGYTEEELAALPRVTTETGYSITEEDGVTEEVQARLFMNIYLSQFKRGWKYTAVYLLKGRDNEPEHESYAFYTLDNRPKQAAHYLHNFTTILADNAVAPRKAKSPAYRIPFQPETVHDLLLQKSDGHFFLVLWGERFTGGADTVEIRFAKKQKILKVYNPTKGTAPVDVLKNRNRIALSLTNHPLMIEISNEK